MVFVPFIFEWPAGLVSWLPLGQRAGSVGEEGELSLAPSCWPGLSPFRWPDGQWLTILGMPRSVKRSREGSSLRLGAGGLWPWAHVVRWAVWTFVFVLQYWVFFKEDCVHPFPMVPTLRQHKWRCILVGRPGGLTNTASQSFAAKQGACRTSCGAAFCLPTSLCCVQCKPSLPACNWGADTI